MRLSDDALRFLMHWVDVIYYPTLVDRLAGLDADLRALDVAIQVSPDPDGLGLLDEVEDIVGRGFFECQHYMIHRKGTRRNAYRVGPRHHGRFVAELLNAGANHWKHQGEWPHESALQPNQRKTLDTILDGGVTERSYPLSDLLLQLSLASRLTTLLPHVIGWRDALDRAASTRGTSVVA